MSYRILSLLALTAASAWISCSSAGANGIDDLKKHVENEVKKKAGQAVQKEVQKEVDKNPNLAFFAAEPSSTTVESMVSLTSAQKAEAFQIIDDTEKNWLNSNGWMRLGPKPSDSDNGYDNENPLLFTAEYLWLLWRLDLLNGELRWRYLEKVRTEIKAMELQPGLYDRYPVAHRPQDVRTFSMDEQLGLIVIDTVFDHKLGVAKDQYDYGEKYHYLYLNAAWSSPDHFDRPIYRSGKIVPVTDEIPHAQRLGAIVEIIKRSVGVGITPASDAIICAGLVLSARANCDGASEPILNLLTMSVLKGQTKLLDRCFLQYKDVLRGKFKTGQVCGGKPVTSPGLFGALADVYFKNDAHPIRRLAAFLPE
jgi:hypothetical protein